MEYSIINERLKKGPPPANVKKGIELASQGVKFPGCNTASSAYPTFNVNNATNEWRLNPIVQTSAFYEAPKNLDQQLGTKNIGTMYGYDTFPPCKSYSDMKSSNKVYEGLDDTRIHDSLQMYYYKPHPCNYPVRPAYKNFVSFK